MLTYKSNAQGVILSISNRIKGIDTGFDKMLRTIAFNLRAENTRRVFNQGMNTDEVKINGGSYSTKTSLATKSQFIKKSVFKPTVIAEGVSYVQNIKTKKYKTVKNKTKKVLWIKFKNASAAVPVMLLPEGYKQLRSLQGKETGYVNLQYSGLLKTKLMVQGSNKSYKVGFESGYGSNIAGYLEDKYNEEIWGLSKTGEKEAIETAERFINDKLKPRQDFPIK